MNDIKTKAKMSVLQDLIETMKQKELEDLKSRSMKSSSSDEETPEEMDETARRFKEFKDMDGSSRDRFAIPALEHGQDMNRSPNDDEDDVEKLKEMYSRLK